MRTVYLVLFLSIFCIGPVFSQNLNTSIGVQGIARTTDQVALVSKTMTFTFTLKDESAATVYSETATITTDAFGVFSHGIGTGNSTTAPPTFEELMFHQEKLSLIISVDIDGVVTEISNSPFQYSAYAKSADNGVPTGSIMPYVGTVAPAGWVLCDGQDISGMAGSAPLIALLGSNNVPNLRGMFLRGAGDDGRPETETVNLNQEQADSFESHSHPGTTNNDGAHIHRIRIDNSLQNDGDGGAGFTKESDDPDYDYDIVNTQSAHQHNFTTDAVGSNETRPLNFGVNYIIKL